MSRCGQGTERGSAPVAVAASWLRPATRCLYTGKSSESSLGMEVQRAGDSKIGLSGCQYAPGAAAGPYGVIGCWCVAASPILRTWPTTPVLVLGDVIAGGTGARQPVARWIIEDCLQGGQAVRWGLDDYEVRLLGRVVPPHHPGDAGPCLRSGGNQVLGRRFGGVMPRAMTKRGLQFPRANSSH